VRSEPYEGSAAEAFIAKDPRAVLGSTTNLERPHTSNQGRVEREQSVHVGTAHADEPSSEVAHDVSHQGRIRSARRGGVSVLGHGWTAEGNGCCDGDEDRSEEAKKASTEHVRPLRNLRARSSALHSQQKPRNTRGAGFNGSHPTAIHLSISRVYF
jgi:hypothetical protein